ncbi:MAG: signal peptidase I [Actinobacteria bacterium]|nr:signal peptidase I [Actinomycetota bacterium]NCU80393.1 signal peptidase I [Acidimicrobiia bacterium]NDC99193.1 signal peptidase I [bacterium]NBO97263.1 signal peptidase I [Actinomycetota bacterium]NBP41470.1 signal peptidase I [Actinomycetota bacterium]
MPDLQFDQTKRRRSMAARQLVEWVVVVAVALVVAMLIRLFLLQQFYISGPSMETTMFTDNRVLVNKLAYRIGDVNRGDIVVFDRVTMNGTDVEHDDLIKRVIALEGEQIEIRKCVVYIDGKALSEPYLPSRDTNQPDLSNRCGTVDMEMQTVEEGSIFLMGDNRPQSFDSRMFGAIKKDLVIGRAFVLIWPPTSWSRL